MLVFRIVPTLLALALLLSAALPLYAAPLAQEEEPTEEVAPPPAMEEEAPPPAEEAPPPADEPAPTEAPTPPTGGPGSDVPWWNWRSQDIPLSLQLGAQLAYQEFWQLRKEALANPTSNLELDMGGVMAGEPLTREVDFLRGLRAKQQAQIVVVEQHPILAYASETEFVIYDSYVDRSYLVDVNTKTPIGPGPDVAPEVVPMAFHIRRVDSDRFPGQWAFKVVDSVRIAN